MRAIYTPKGRAREYAALALNVNTSCSHGCKYCYCRTYRKNFRDEHPKPRRGIVEALKQQLEADPPRHRVFLSFLGDPCDRRSADNCDTTVACLDALAAYPVAILSKGGKQLVDVIERTKHPADTILAGQTLTGTQAIIDEWEPNAAPYGERLETFARLREMGCQTFASFEPLIKPCESLQALNDVVGLIDEARFGAISTVRSCLQPSQACKYLTSATQACEKNGVRIIVKKELERIAKKGAAAINV